METPVSFFSQFNWLSVNFGEWKNWEDDSDEDLASFDKFSEVSISNAHSPWSERIQTRWSFEFALSLSLDDEQHGRR